MTFKIEKLIYRYKYRYRYINIYTHNALLDTKKKMMKKTVVSLVEYIG